MSKTAPALPQGISLLMPRLFCRDPVAEIEFCKIALGALELNRRAGTDGVVLHALLRISGAMLMIEAEIPALPNRAPSLDGSSPVAIYVYVEDVDTTVERAMSEGAKLVLGPKDQFWGDRTAWIMDPCGHVWTIAARIEDTSAQQRSDRWNQIKSSS